MPPRAGLSLGLTPPPDTGIARASSGALESAAAGTSAAVSSTAEVSRPSPRAVILPLSPEYYRLQVTLRAETHARLRQAQELMRHQIPNGDPAEILDRALKDLVEKLSRRKFAALTRSRTGGW